MTVQEIMVDLRAHGNEGIKKTLLKHGVKEPFFGVKVEDMKPIQKKVKTNYQLAKDLYATGNADAMYLAGLIADDERMTVIDLQTWVEQAVSDNISSYTVPWVAAGSKVGYQLAMKWIDAKEKHIVSAGWSTLSNILALKPDSELDLQGLKALLQRVAQTIHFAPNHLKKAMNSFVIAVGSYVAPLTDEAIVTAKKIGALTIEMDGTACKVPDAGNYIKKVKDKGSLGKKKKTVKC